MCNEPARQLAKHTQLQQKGPQEERPRALKRFHDHGRRVDIARGGLRTFSQSGVESRRVVPCDVMSSRGVECQERHTQRGGGEWKLSRGSRKYLVKNCAVGLDACICARCRSSGTAERERERERSAGLLRIVASTCVSTETGHRGQRASY